MSKTLAGLAAVLTLAATASTAAAEAYAAPPAKQGYLGVGVSLGGQRSLKRSTFIDGGKRLGASPLHIRGQLTGGTSGDDTGSFSQLRAGIEMRTCTVGQLVCVFAGTDVGYQRDQIENDKELSGLMGIDAHDALVVPRAGIELGTRIRARLAVEVPLYVRLDASEPGYADRTGAGLMLAFAVAGVF